MAYYDVWGRQKEEESRSFSEKAFRRKSLAGWDAKWHALSVSARSWFLNEVKSPVKQQRRLIDQPTMPREGFPQEVLRELLDARFVVPLAAKDKGGTKSVAANAELTDFVSRLRTLRRLHLLDAQRPSEFPKYVDQIYYAGSVGSIIAGVLRAVGIEDYVGVEAAIERYVIHHRWPGWVVRSLQDPLAERIVAVIQKAEGPIPVAELPGRIAGADPEKVRAAMDKLIVDLALVEDLNPETWDLMVGLLPSVRADLKLAAQPRQRPALAVCELPSEFGPSESVVVDDLRSVLLEVASEPPLLRQDRTLFQKEHDRFQAVLEPQPEWFLQALKWSPESRLIQALGWASALDLIKEAVEGKQTRMHLNAKGQKWLAGSVDEQYAAVFDLLRAPTKGNELYSPHRTLFYPGLDIFNSHSGGDMRFLGAHIVALKASKGKQHSIYYWQLKNTDHQPLRDALDKAFSELPAGVFHRLDSVEAHLGFGKYNPINLGLDMDKVSVFELSRAVPALEERREEVGRLLIDTIIRRRLIPLGCVQTATDAQGHLCIAREPRLDAYFGRKLPRSSRAPAAEEVSKVVVQPDFSVIVIGLNPAPAAELAPFCERTTRGGGHGALTLKITRESVVKAVSHGLKPAEIVARLQRHASNEVPANVLKEVQEWSRWVRHVNTSTITVLRCPDKETADRVASALKRQAERVNDTLVAIDQKKLTSAERTKLRDQGIIVKGESAPAETVKKRRSW